MICLKVEKEKEFSYFLSQFFSCLHHYEFDILTGSHIADDK